jgi:hypothetical protein
MFSRVKAALLWATVLLCDGASGFHVSPSYIPPDAEDSEKIASVIAVLAISGLANRYTPQSCPHSSARNFVRICIARNCVPPLLDQRV